MAISLGTALLGSAVIGGGLSAIGGSKNARAINNATDANVALARESNALARDIYGLNSSNISPFMQRGNTAGDTINAFLGLSGRGTQAQQESQRAFEQYKDFTGYDWARRQGEDALTSAFGAGGSLQSGAALKALQDRGQNQLLGKAGEWLNLLSGQQAVGLSGANALAGVGTNYVGNVTANNNAQGNALWRGTLAGNDNRDNMFSGLASSFGTGLGALTRF